jgi:DNA topoisomerase IA
MSSNSAHDDVKVLLNEDEATSLKRQLKDSSREDAEILSNVFTIVNDFGQAAAADNWQVDTRTLVFEEEGSGVQISIDVHNTDIPGWIDHLPERECDLSENSGETLTELDLDALLAGSYSYLQQDEENLDLDTLLRTMESYSIGRPANYALQLENLVEKQFIQFDATEDSVRLTQKGFELAAVLKNCVPELTSKRFSNDFYRDIEAIASKPGVTSQIIIADYVERLFGAERRQKVEDKLWRSIDEITLSENDKTTADNEQGVLNISPGAERK